MDISKVTVCIMAKNEDHWIYYTLRDISKIFLRIIFLDTGSTDRTKEIVRTFSNVTLIEEDYGNDAKKIGNGRNVLRDACPTELEFMIDADEIWTTPMLEKLIQQEIPEDKVIMLGTCELQAVEGIIKIRDNDFVNRDRIFPRGIKWSRLDYPFESHNLENRPKHYIDAREIYAWHVRHTVRSSKNAEAFFRNEKYNYFPYDKFVDLPEGWIGEVDRRFPNPYLWSQDGYLSEIS